VIGYGVYQQGVFPFLRGTGKVSAGLLYCHYVEVLPEYRGQRIHAVIAKAADAYGRRNGAKQNCATIPAHNRPSILSTLRAGSTVVGKVERVAILKGLLWWETPWEEVAAALSQGRPAQEMIKSLAL